MGEKKSGTIIPLCALPEMALDFLKSFRLYPAYGHFLIDGEIKTGTLMSSGIFGLMSCLIGNQLAYLIHIQILSSLNIFRPSSVSGIKIIEYGIYIAIIITFIENLFRCLGALFGKKILKYPLNGLSFGIGYTLCLSLLFIDRMDLPKILADGDSLKNNLPMLLGYSLKLPAQLLICCWLVKNIQNYHLLSILFIICLHFIYNSLCLILFYYFGPLFLITLFQIIIALICILILGSSFRFYRGSGQIE